MKNIAKLDLLQKLKARTKDLRGNENERLVAEKQLDILMKKYGITEEDLVTEERHQRDFYFKEDWEQKLIAQVLYTIIGTDAKIYQYKGKRNWICSNLTDAEYIEFEMMYPVYKQSFKKELDIFYLAFINKNNIFPTKDKIKEEIEDTKSTKYSRQDRMKAAMMAEGIEFTQVRRQITDGEN